MARHFYYLLSVASLTIIAALSLIWTPVLWFLLLVLPIIALGIYDLRSSHNILRNYPVIGHLRYLFEFIRPEIQQYFVNTNLSGRPFNREQRSLVYRRAKDLDDTHPFGTEYDISDSGYEFAVHSIHANHLDMQHAHIEVGGPQCRQPYRASRLNISAMSFGALSATAVQAMNRGAKIGGFAHNTGEGGLSPYHLAEGGDIIWQIGTGYFGCRTIDGKFDSAAFAEKATLDVVKMIEIKISQGAKPSHGGVLPAAKIDAEIARMRGITMDEDCISPPQHSTFSTPLGLLQFVQQLRELSGGKPTGFKLCLGRREEFLSICKAMLETQILPDFITVDGAEGGTGAAPVEFSNNMGAPINEALAFVHNALVGCNLRQHIRLIANGKVISGFDVVSKLALGADMCGMARAMMFAVGCIQALRCNDNTCPTGVTTQDPIRQRAIVIPLKAQHVANYHRNTMKSFLSLAGAMGVTSPSEITPDLLYFRVDAGNSLSYRDLFHFIEPGNFLTTDIHDYYRPYWQRADANHF